VKRRLVWTISSLDLLAGVGALAALHGCTPSQPVRTTGGNDATAPEQHAPTSASADAPTTPRSAEGAARGGSCVHERSKEPGTLVSGLTIPAKHPRLWWTPERLARAKTWLATHPFTPASEDFLGHAFLHAVKGADCSKAINAVMALTIADSEFNVASDNVRWNGENVILTYDWCFDQLKPEQRATLLKRWNGYLGKSMLLQYGGPQMPSNNYNWGSLRNEIEWGIVAQGESPSATTLLEHGLAKRYREGFLPYAEGKKHGDGRGGIPQEGTQYGPYVATYSIAPFVTAGLLGQSLYDETEFFKNAVFYVIYATTPGPTTSAVDGATAYELFPFGDDEKWQEHASANHFADYMAQAATTWNCLPVGGHARAWSRRTGAKPSAWVASVDAGGDALDLTTLPLDYYGAGLHYYYGRSAWGGGATAFHWQLGDTLTGEHAHYDAGNWQIWRGGRWLSRETTGYSDAFTGVGGTGIIGSEKTPSHNTLLVNGVGLSEPSDEGKEGPPIVRRLESQPEYAYADVDLSKAYHNPDPGHPDRDNPAVDHVERELVFLRGLETTVIFDRVKSKAAGGAPPERATKTFLAHFEQKPTIDDPNHVNYTSGKQELRLTVLVPKSPTTRAIDERTPKGKNGQFRLEVTTSGAAQSYFLTVLQAKDVGAPALSPAVTEDATKFVVTLNPSTTLVFMKGTASEGGSVTIGGKSRNLRPDVQPIKITDAGPRWL
jgi:hypothetical protein